MLSGFVPALSISEWARGSGTGGAEMANAYINSEPASTKITLYIGVQIKNQDDVEGNSR